MSWLRDPYSSDSASPAATFVISVGSALLFTVGSFLIINAHFRQQARSLEKNAQAIQAVSERKDISLENLTTDNLTVNDEAQLHDVEAGGDLTVSGETNLEGDTTIGGNLEVSGTAGLNTQLAVEGDTSLGSTLNVLGSTEFGGDLEVTAAATLQASASVGGDTSIGDSLTVSGRADFQGDVDVTGITQLKGNAQIGGDSNFSAPEGMTSTSFTVQGVATLGGDLGVSGVTSLQQSLSVTGADSTSTFDGTGTSGATTILLGSGPTFQVNGATALQGDLNVAGTTLLGSSLSLTSINNISADFTPTSTFDATGVSAGTTILLGSNPSFQVNGATALQGDLNVAGTTLLGGSLTLTPISTASADFIPTSTFDATGTNGASTILLGSNPSFQVNGATAMQGDLNVAGTTLLSSTLTLTAINNTSVDFSPTNTFDATGTNGTATILLGTNPSFQVNGATSLQGDLSIAGTTLLGSTLNVAAINTASPDFSPTTTFDATGTDSGGNTILLGASPSFQVSGAATLQGDVNVNGTAVMASLSVTTPNAGSPDFNPTVTFDATLGAGYATFTCGAVVVSFCVQGATSLTGDMTVSGTGFLNSTLTVTGSADFDGNFTVNCLSNCSAYTATVGGNIITEGNITAFGRITTRSHFTVYDDAGAGTPYTGIGGIDNGGPVDCAAGSDAKYLRNPTIVGGIITGGACSDTITGTGDGKKCDGADVVEAIELDNGLVKDVWCTGDSGADYAEYYPSTQTLVAGEVVSIDPNNPEYVVRSTGLNDQLAIGIVSTEPGKVIGRSADGNAIALSGRVPVKVNNEGGAIEPGDYLTTASTPGYAKKATPGEKTIGQAMAAFNGETGTVIVFVSIDQGTVTNPNAIQSTGDFTSLNVMGPSVMTDLQVTGTATIVNLQVTGLANLTTLKVSGHIIGNADTRGTLTIPAGAVTVHYDFLTAYETIPAIVASPIDQPVAFSVIPTANGFDIKISSPSSTDIKFNYLVQQ